MKVEFLNIEFMDDYRNDTVHI